MKKLKISLYFLLVAAIMISCEKDSIIPSDSELNNVKGISSKESETSKDKSKIDVCHFDAVTGTWNAININSNALADHLSHGDSVLDADDDGYTARNECGIGSQDDCDDTNPAINPGTVEICDNGIDDNCDGYIDEGCTIEVPIGEQTWMLKNLDVEKYRDGTVIPEVKDPIAWVNLRTGAWCYYVKPDGSTDGATYGKLYNWYAIMGITAEETFPPTAAQIAARKQIAPIGWHVPTDGEWTRLTTFLNEQDPAGNVGDKMKEKGEAPDGTWSSPNTAATNSSGFTGLAGGYRENRWGEFLSIGLNGSWWTAEGTIGNFPSVLRLNSTSSDALRPQYRRREGLSVRCLKD
jgi:uncharacterized protein (TIGR02145 family)